MHIAHQHSHIATHLASLASREAVVASTWAAIHAHQTHMRRAQGLFAILADRCLGELAEAVISVLSLSTSARRVTVSADQQRHILLRRQITSTMDAEISANRLSEALSQLVYWRLPQRDPRVYELVGFVASARRHLLIALKLVPANGSKSGSDEWWVRTAHPLGKKVMRRLLKAGFLQPLNVTDATA